VIVISASDGAAKTATIANTESVAQSRFIGF
jgi:hypothetical protein